MIVLDASATLAGLFEDERTPAIVALFDAISTSAAHVPGHWRLEVANGLRMAIRRGRTDLAFRDSSLERLVRLPIAIDGETSVHAWGATLRLADRYGLTPYDAAYLELAQRRRVPLATRDSALRAAALDAGIEADDYAG